MIDMNVTESVKQGLLKEGEKRFWNASSLRDEFVKQLELQLREMDLSRAASRWTVTFQIDNRPAGVWAHTDAENPLNKTACFFHAFNVHEARRRGIYLRFDASEPAFRVYPVYWLMAPFFAWLSVIFKKADIMFVGTENAVLYGSLHQRLLELPPSLDDQLIGASDRGAPLNSGWLYLKRAETPCIEPSDLDGTTWKARMDELDVVISALKAGADIPFARRCPSALHVPTSQPMLKKLKKENLLKTSKQ